MAISIPSAETIIKLVKSGATIEAQERIMELRQAMMSLQEENLDLRQKVQALEARVTELGNPALPRCPKCQQPAWKLESSREDDIFGQLGGMRRLYRCAACGFQEDRLDQA